MMALKWIYLFAYLVGLINFSAYWKRKNRGFDIPVIGTFFICSPVLFPFAGLVILVKLFLPKSK